MKECKKIVFSFNSSDEKSFSVIQQIINNLNNANLESSLFDPKKQNAPISESRKYEFIPKNQITDVPYRFIAAELVREKLMDRLHHELPYGLTVETEDWNGLDDGSIRIDMLIYVHKLGQKKILIGKNGNNLKLIGSSVRKELQIMLKRDIHEC